MTTETHMVEVAKRVMGAFKREVDAGQFDRFGGIMEMERLTQAYPELMIKFVFLIWSTGYTDCQKNIRAKLEEMP